jgi:hypothetical protein
MAWYLFGRHRRDLFRELGVYEKISVELFSGFALGDGVHPIAPADKTIFREWSMPLIGVRGHPALGTLPRPFRLLC